MMALGAVGIISVVANAFPKQVAQLTQLCTEGKYAEARPIHESLLHITDLCFVEGNPCGVKYILQQKGFGQDYVRLPLVPVGSQIQEKIKAELQVLGT
jgi:4-hydroxy-tetrahydrodipicolinate synthase